MRRACTSAAATAGEFRSSVVYAQKLLHADSSDRATFNSVEAAGRACFSSPSRAWICGQSDQQNYSPARLRDLAPATARLSRSCPRNTWQHKRARAQAAFRRSSDNNACKRASLRHRQVELQIETPERDSMMETPDGDSCKDCLTETPAKVAILFFEPP